MHRSIRVTGGHALDSHHRYKDDVQSMVLYELCPPNGESDFEYQCIRLFVNKKALRAIEKMQEHRQIKIVYCVPVRNGEIYDLDHRDKIRREKERERNNGKSNETEG